MYLYLPFKDRNKFKSSKNPNIGSIIAIRLTTGKVSPSEKRNSLQFPATIMKSENSKETIFQNSDCRKDLPKTKNVPKNNKPEAARPKFVKNIFVFICLSFSASKRLKTAFLRLLGGLISAIF